MTKRTPGPDPFNNPFSKVKLEAPSRAEPPRPAAPVRQGKPVALDAEAALFLEAMGEVATIKADRKRVGAGERARPDPVKVANEEAESLAQLAQLVAPDSPPLASGDGAAVPGLDPQVLRRLRAGDFVVDARLEATGQVALEQFLAAARRLGQRCLLVPREAAPWLSRGRLGRAVLAFCPALPPADGAVWVLLRR